VTRYPGERAACAELLSLISDEVRFADRWAIVDWIRREMHAASPDEILALFDRAQTEVASRAAEHEAHVVLARLDALRDRTREIVWEQTVARGTTSEDLVDAMHEMIRVAEPALLTHLAGVGSLAGRIAKDLGLDDSDAYHVTIAGRLCDIGKIAGSAGTHPLVGERMVAAVAGLSEYAGWVRWHHERLDGSGYPDGLREHDIPFEARIVGVADVFDEMVSAKRHGSAGAVTAAMQHLTSNAGSLYDQQVVASLERVLTSKRRRTNRQHAA
jgi:HD-GYP domain-containing protein (c-di-GMP phosphodiesterase class II)